MIILIPHSSRLMKSPVILAVFSLAAICSSALAKSGDYQRLPDPEGQFPRLGACPDPHACIFPPDVYVISQVSAAELLKPL